MEGHILGVSLFIFSLSGEAAHIRDNDGSDDDDSHYENGHILSKAQRDSHKCLKLQILIADFHASNQSVKELWHFYNSGCLHWN